TLGQVTFLANPRYTPRLKTTKASAVYVSEDLDVGRNDIAALRTKNPYLAYTRALILFNPEPAFQAQIHPSAVIDASARIPEDVFIGPCVVIGRNVALGADVQIHANATIYDNVTIGEGSVIHSGVAIRENSVLGKRVIVHNNAVIGCDGFGYA